jgi:hypothetical protein
MTWKSGLIHRGSRHPGPKTFQILRYHFQLHGTREQMNKILRTKKIITSNNKQQYTIKTFSYRDILYIFY